jgi:acetyl-CoA acetyltransferase
VRQRFNRIATAGNASGLNDGAGILLITSEQKTQN